MASALGVTVPKDARPALCRVTALMAGDVVRTSSKGKNVRITKTARDFENVTISLSNSDVRTYHHEEKIILVYRPEDQNL